MDQQTPESNSNIITTKDMLRKVISGINYIKHRWKVVVVAALIGATLGVVYALYKTPSYKAVCTFVLEDSKSNGGQFGGLAALAGIDLGTSAGGIFEGDNIFELYKSRTMIEKTLLSSCVFNGREELLIDRLIDHSGLRSKKKGDDKIGQIDFHNNPDKFTRQQDSIITVLVAFIDAKILNVTKPDKKLSIISVEVTTQDELLSKCFTDKIVQTVNDFYIQTKTKKSLQNVLVLQHQADSVKLILNSSLEGVASAIDADPNANPLMSRLRVSSQKRQVDVQANTAMYSQIVQNLQLAKISLRQEMPLIQVVDKPVLPLEVNRVKMIKSIVVGMILFALSAIFLLIIRKVFKMILA